MNIAFDEHHIPGCGHATAQPRCRACSEKVRELKALSVSQPLDLHLVVSVPSSYRRRIILLELRRFFRERGYDPGIWPGLAQDFVRQWINRHGFIEFLGRWGITLKRRQYGNGDTGTYYVRDDHLRLTHERAAPDYVQEEDDEGDDDYEA